VHTAKFIFDSFQWSFSQSMPFESAQFSHILWWRIYFLYLKLGDTFTVIMLSSPIFVLFHKC
jgi:hypothetical protein